jgi:hypothetical protein
MATIVIQYAAIVAAMPSCLEQAAAPLDVVMPETNGADGNVAAEFVRVGGLTTTTLVLVLRAAAEEVTNEDPFCVRVELRAYVLDWFKPCWDDGDTGEREVEKAVNEGRDTEPEVVIVAVFSPIVVGAAELGSDDFSGC